MRTTIPLQSNDEARTVLGVADRNARLFRAAYDVAITVRGGELVIEGSDEGVAAATRAAAEIMRRFRAAGHVDEREVDGILKGGGAGGAPGAPTLQEREAVVRSRMGRMVLPRTPGQHAYVKALAEDEVVFAIGPAGTGKTYLAVAMAVRMLREGRVKKLILCRPAVEAGEKLGFLPGTYEAKINPYLRPLYDALFDLVEPAQIRKFSENDVIEVAPLAYMRGRTLADSFIILDEAQNTTAGQMKMFLTRMGEGSRLVVTGDITQIDLPQPVASGLVHAMNVLRGIPGIVFCHFDKRDVVRNPVVQRIVDAYERHEGDGS
ncbi:MAG: PhoH family protein [Planctomycetes bacterium]|nr:PhoH family protein [Planctomycetota bacterium]